MEAGPGRWVLALTPPLTGMLSSLALRQIRHVTFPKDQVRGVRTRSLPLPQPALASMPPAAPRTLLAAPRQRKVQGAPVTESPRTGQAGESPGTRAGGSEPLLAGRLGGMTSSLPSQQLRLYYSSL